MDDDNGYGGTINVNENPAVWHHFAGVWDQSSGTRKLYVDGVLSIVNYNALGQTMRLAPSQALTLGARADGVNGYQAYLAGLLYDVRIYKQALFASEVQTVMTTPTTLQAPEAKLTPSASQAGWQHCPQLAARWSGQHRSGVTQRQSHRSSQFPPVPPVTAAAA